MLRKLGTVGLIGALLAVLGVALITYRDPVIGAGLMLIVAGLALAVRGLASGLLRMFGMP